MYNQKNISDKIASEYRELKRERENKLNRKLEFLHSIDSEFEMIEREISMLGISMASKLAGKGANIEDIMSEIESRLDILKEKRESLYRKYDIDTNFLETSYECTLCNDTGYTPDGKKCSCRIQREIKYAKAASSIPPELGGYSFDDFELEYYSKIPDGRYGLSAHENILSVLDTCKAFCDNFENSNENLYIYGNPGLGKTMLVTCMANELISKNNIVMYQTASNLFKILEGYKFGKDTGEEINLLYDQLYNCDLLIIDDLGTEFQNSFTQSMLFDILNTRLLSKKSTVISSNLIINDLKKTYTERISSRILGEYELLLIFGEDIRIQKKKLQ